MFHPACNKVHRIKTCGFQNRGPKMISPERAVPSILMFWSRQGLLDVFRRGIITISLDNATAILSINRNSTFVPLESILHVKFQPYEDAWITADLFSSQDFEEETICFGLEFYFKWRKEALSFSFLAYFFLNSRISSFSSSKWSSRRWLQKHLCLLYPGTEHGGATC